MADVELHVKNILNFNIGVLGHVDSGKTSLSRALSSVASTAAFDKNPQSKERGITLDLGFSSFFVDVPEHLKKEGSASYDSLQFTLVDCPGHASLIKTIIGGAQIIDMMMLVVDIDKGMQTQTAECLVIGEILCEKMVIVLNKVDLVDEAKRQATIEKMRKRMLKTLENTKFANSPIVAVAANVGAKDALEVSPPQRIGMEELIGCLRQQSYIPQRNPGGAFMFAVDHCFSIRGQGTVMTGTVLSGTVSVNDNVEIPVLKEIKKVKSMQMFRKPVKSISQGDRAGICVTQFDPKKLERGVVCTPGHLPTLYGGVVRVCKIPYFKGKCENKAKFHITVGHETVMAKLQFFGLPEGTNATAVLQDSTGIDRDKEYAFQEQLSNKTVIKKGKDAETVQYAILEFDRPIIGQEHSLVIGSRLDTDINLNTCRLAFFGNIVLPFLTKDYHSTVLPTLKIFKCKYKEGSIERMADDYSVIVKSLFKKETKLALFANMKVTLSTGEHGTIEGSFGQSGKVKIHIPNGLHEATKSKLSVSKKKKNKETTVGDASAEQQQPTESVKVRLDFKKYIYDTNHKMVQS